jgi:hypothetical protein
MPRWTLDVPATPCWVPLDVFDAYGWCASDTLTLTAPAPVLRHLPVSAENPGEMLFVIETPPPFVLPREAAAGHAPRWFDAATHILAPYAIDDATDGFFEHRVAPRAHLSLWTDSVRGVFWGLHDWCHFHNHGPFEQRALTELQCDATALYWLARNADHLGLDATAWRTLCNQVIDLTLARVDEDEAVSNREAAARLVRRTYQAMAVLLEAAPTSEAPQRAEVIRRACDT